MIINKIDISIYGIFIFISLLIGTIFNYIYLKRNKIEKNRSLLFIFMMSIYTILGGILLNAFTTNDFSLSNLGLSSYGGAIGIIVSCIIFEKMSPSNGIFIKSSVISLPLIYSISKLSCFFSGCCYGIPYDGKFSVIYIGELNIALLPIQLIETIAFMIIFIICILLNKNKKIIGITIFLSAISKFLLDFFRYSHLEETISINQIISIIFILIGILLILKQHNCKTID